MRTAQRRRRVRHRRPSRQHRNRLRLVRRRRAFLLKYTRTFLWATFPRRLLSSVGVRHLPRPPQRLLRARWVASTIAQAAWSDAATGLPVLEQSGCDIDVTPLGVKQPRAPAGRDQSTGIGAARAVPTQRLCSAMMLHLALRPRISATPEAATRADRTASRTVWAVSQWCSSSTQAQLSRAA